MTKHLIIDGLRIPLSPWGEGWGEGVVCYSNNDHPLTRRGILTSVRNQHQGPLRPLPKGRGEKVGAYA